MCNKGRNQKVWVNYKEKEEKAWKNSFFGGKDKLNTIEVLISKYLVDLCISHDEFVSVNNVLRKYN